MASPDPTSTAYQVGQVIGVLMVIGFPALFGYLVYQYFSHRQTKHLVLAIITGIPTLAIVALFIFGFISGMSRAMKERQNQVPLTESHAQELKEGKWDEVNGKKFRYRFALPEKSNWTTKTGIGDFDQIVTYREIYVGIIPERLDIELDKYIEIVQNNTREQFADVEYTNEEEVEIDGQVWVRFDMKLTVDGLKLQYRNHLCAAEGRVVQVLSWTHENQFALSAELINKIAESFRFGEF